MDARFEEVRFQLRRLANGLHRRGFGIMSDMNIEYTGRLYDAAKVRRFAGKVYDRVARASRIMLSVFIVVGLAAEVLAYLRGGHLDLYLLFLLALIFFALKFNRVCEEGDG